MNRAQLDVRTQTNRFTLVAFLSTAVMLFAAFTAAYLIRRTAADWEPVVLPGVLWLNTGVLLASSLTIEVARRKGARSWLSLTVVLGIVFIAGQVAAWGELASRGIFLPTQPHSAFVYMLTAVHGLHLLGGIVALFFAVARKADIALCALYWHFVDGVWIYLLLVLSCL